jgi:DNA repair photolyase
MPESFENRIIIKENPEKLLEKKLAGHRILKDVIGIGGVTDAYQGAEKIYRNTRNCLKVIESRGFPVHIATKSDLILEDLELLESIARKSWCSVSITITTTDSATSQWLEGRCINPQKRFAVLNKIKSQSEKIQTGIALIPVVPCLTDKETDLDLLMKTAKENGADYIISGGGITMHDRQAVYFLNTLKKDFPHFISEYERLFSFRYDENEYHGKSHPDRKYLLYLNNLILEKADKYQLPLRMKRYIPQDFRKDNYRLSEILFNESYMHYMKGKEDAVFRKLADNINNLSSSVSDMNDQSLIQQLSLSPVEFSIIKCYMDRLSMRNLKTLFD